MDKNSIEFQELEELRGQVSLLKEKLMRQQIISERAIIEAAQKGIGKLNKTGKMWGAFGIFAVVYCTFIFHRIGFSDAFVAFMATFSFFGGLVVFIYPNDVFVEYLLVDLQTMIHHGLQIVLGIFFMVYYRKRLNLKFFAKGILVFLALATVAMGINLLAPTFTAETVNMFYISPYFPCTLVILDGIYASVPYIVFLLIYLLGFILAGLVMFLIMWGIISLVKKAKNKKQVAL